jgi:hypothetical protein
MASENGGVIGKNNVPDYVNEAATTTEILASGDFAIPPVSNVNLVLVGGGGAGGAAGPEQHGGGGAGGMVFYPAMPVGPGTFPVTIGAGAASKGTTSGTDSVFNYPGNIITAKGGGGQHTDGGSGGGRRSGNQPYAGSATQPSQSGDSGTHGFGSPGGSGAGGWPNHGGDGGGGASAAGSGGSASSAGNGGAGKDVTPLFPGASLTSGTLAGGGAGGSNGPTGSGGAGGGGASNNGGTANTGGGGGAGNSSPGLGGSGIAIVYTPSYQDLQNTSGVWSLKGQYLARKGGNWTSDT